MKRTIQYRALSEWMFCIVLFWAGDSVYFKSSDFISALFEIMVLMIGALLLLQLGKPISRKALKRFVLVFLVNSVSLGVIILVSLDNNVWSNVLQKIFIYCFAIPMFYLLYAQYGLDYIKVKLFPKYTSIVAAVSFVGLVLWILLNFGIHLPSVTVQYNWGGSHIANGVLGLVFPIQLSDQSFLPAGIYRYTLFYTEGSVAAGYFLISLMIELCICRYKRRWVCIILVCSAICTLSTYGLIATPVILMLCLISSKDVRKRIRSTAILYYFFLVLVLFSILGIAIWIDTAIASKENVTSVSVYLAGFMGGFQAFLVKPLFGWGIGNYSAMNLFVENAGWTSSLMLGLTQGGIVLISLVVVPFLICILRARYCTEWSYVAFGIVMLTMYVNGCSDNSLVFGAMLALAYYLYTEMKILHK